MTASKFVRNRFTLSTYLLLGFYAYMQTSLAPIMPFVRAELSLNYTTTALHLSSFAFGMIITGTTGAYVAEWLGRRRLFWGGGVGMIIGALLLSLAQVAPLTLLGAFMMGWLGSYLLVMIQSTLADEHGTNRAIALTESNIVASIFAALAPLVVGFGATTIVTWRIAVLLAGGLWLIIFIASHNMTLPATRTTLTDTQSQKQLPRLFWWYWAVMFLCVALEWVIFFWAADFLEKIVGLSTEAAASILSVFLIAIIIGRIIGSRLAYRFASQHLLWLAIGLISLGFPFFWLGQAQWVNIGGLFVVGLGIANLFPMGLSIASKVGESASDLASSRVSLAAGLAIFLLPQVLGSLADFIGIFNAFGIIPIFIISFVLILAYANRQLGHYLKHI